jgi:hypothetical protein
LGECAGWNTFWRVPVQPDVVPRSDLTRLLGQSLLEGHALEVCREYALAARPGARFYESREHGVEVAVDEYGRVIAIRLHFGGVGGFRPYPGAIPGRGGTIPRRSSMWAALGRPAQSTDPFRDRGSGTHGPADEWQFPTFVMHAQYALDGEHLRWLTLGR